MEGYRNNKYVTLERHPKKRSIDKTGKRKYFCMYHQSLVAFGLIQIRNLGRYDSEVDSYVGKLFSNWRDTEGIPEKNTFPGILLLLLGALFIYIYYIYFFIMYIYIYIYINYCIITRSYQGSSLPFLLPQTLTGMAIRVIWQGKTDPPKDFISTETTQQG